VVYITFTVYSGIPNRFEVDKKSGFSENPDRREGQFIKHGTQGAWPPRFCQLQTPLKWSVMPSSTPVIVSQPLIAS